jgi:hypothetical protein
MVAFPKITFTLSYPFFEIVPRLSFPEATFFCIDFLIKRSITFFYQVFEKNHKIV